MNQRASAVGRFPLEVAEQIAAALLTRLAPFCASSVPMHRDAEKKGEQPGVVALQIAGSIRRRRPDVGDIDLVAIPKLEQVTTGLFTTETQRPRDSRLAVEFCALTGKLMARGDSIVRGQLVRDRGIKPDEVQSAIRHAAFDAIGVDLYLCTPETWATTLLIRTGSAEHNIWLAQRARAIGGKLHADGSGLELPGQYDPQLQRTVNTRRLVPRDEQEIFAALVGIEQLACPNVAPMRGISLDEIILPELREIVHGRPLWLSEKTNADERRGGK